jgi:hypothetical protein
MVERFNEMFEAIIACEEWRRFGNILEERREISPGYREISTHD